MKPNSLNTSKKRPAKVPAGGPEKRSRIEVNTPTMRTANLDSNTATVPPFHPSPVLSSNFSPLEPSPPNGAGWPNMPQGGDVPYQLLNFVPSVGPSSATHDDYANTSLTDALKQLRQLDVHNSHTSENLSEHEIMEFLNKNDRKIDRSNKFTLEPHAMAVIEYLSKLIKFKKKGLFLSLNINYHNVFTRGTTVLSNLAGRKLEGKSFQKCVQELTLDKVRKDENFRAIFGPFLFRLEPSSSKLSIKGPLALMMLHFEKHEAMDDTQFSNLLKADMSTLRQAILDWDSIARFKKLWSWCNLDDPILEEDGDDRVRGIGQSTNESFAPSTTLTAITIRTPVTLQQRTRVQATQYWSPSLTAPQSISLFALEQNALRQLRQLASGHKSKRLSETEIKDSLKYLSSHPRGEPKVRTTRTLNYLALLIQFKSKGLFCNEGINYDECFMRGVTGLGSITGPENINTKEVRTSILDLARKDIDFRTTMGPILYSVKRPLALRLPLKGWLALMLIHFENNEAMSDIQFDELLESDQSARRQAITEWDDRICIERFDRSGLGDSPERSHTTHLRQPRGISGRNAPANKGQHTDDGVDSPEPSQTTHLPQDGAMPLLRNTPASTPTISPQRPSNELEPPGLPEDNIDDLLDWFS